MAAADETPRAYRALPKDEVRRRRIAVVGGGLTGTATAYAAARLGGADVAIDLYEATQIGHEGGASIDSVRLFRHAYGDLSHYTRWAAETFRSGVSWSGKARRRSTSRTGASGRCTPRTTWPSRPRWGTCSCPRIGEPSSKAATRHLSALGLPNEILDGRAYQRRFPQFASTGVVAAFLDVNSGLVLAREAVLALSEVSRRFGVRVHEAKRAVEVVPSAGLCGVRFSDGTSIEADVPSAGHPAHGITAPPRPPVRLS